MKIITIALLILLTGCDFKKGESDKKYQYPDDFKLYFSSTFRKEIVGNKKIFVIPLNSCGQCVDSALHKLVKYKLNWDIIFVGYTEDSIRKYNMHKIMSNYVYFNDSAEVITEYAVGIALPTLMEADELGRIVSKTEFHWGSWKFFQIKNLQLMERTE